MNGMDTWASLTTVVRRWFGIAPVTAAVFVVALGIAGAILGITFPKFEAGAFLQFPGTSEASKKSGVPAVKLQFYRRMMESYSEPGQIAGYLKTKKSANSTADDLLLRQFNGPSLFGGAVTPLLPYMARNARQVDDRNTPDSPVLGVHLTFTAGTSAEAIELIRLLGGYLRNAVIREQIRSWVRDGMLESRSAKDDSQASILRANMNIELNKRRIEDIKSLLSRYPDARKMDSRQIVINSSGKFDERYLSPLTQLIGAESEVAQLRGQIEQLEGRVQQAELLSHFFSAAMPMADKEADADKLLFELDQAANQIFAAIDSKQDWASEAKLKVGAALADLNQFRSQFNVPSDVRVYAVHSRDPLRLALFGAGAGVLLLGALAFLRASLRDEPEPEFDKVARREEERH